jgi:hypothetical protein
LPLPTLLAHALVAMTIGIDNEIEQRMPHQTALGRKRGVIATGPWLVSWATWANILRFVPPAGITISDFRRLPGAEADAFDGKNPGVIRWGYVTRTGDIVRPTRALAAARDDVFPLVPAAVEARWAEHFGAAVMADVGRALDAVLAPVAVVLPRALPRADNLMWTRWEQRGPAVDRVEDLDVVAKLAQVLLLFALDHEAGAAAPLTMAANLLRVVPADGTTMKDALVRSGISKEAMAYLTGWRQVTRLTAESESKRLLLTPAGIDAGDDYRSRAESVEQAWAHEQGADVVGRLRRALERIVVAPTLDRSPLAPLVDPPPDCWRAWVKRPTTLPHYPMMLHRGGYPDGA